MKFNVLTICNLRVTVGSKLVLQGVNLEIRKGEVQALLGNNGSGKSSLAMTLMGDVRYNVTTNEQTNKPTVLFEGKDLLAMTPDARARAGLYVAWQSPVSIPGVSVFSLCKTSYEAQGKKINKLTEFKQKLEELAERVGLTPDHVGRSVNGGFSGGERKRLEMLQLLLLLPKLVILDEIDSGLDADGLKMVAEVIREMKARGTSFMLITHNKRVLEDLKIDKTWEMKNGQLQSRV